MTWQQIFVLCYCSISVITQLILLGGETKGVAIFARSVAIIIVSLLGYALYSAGFWN